MGVKSEPIKIALSDGKSVSGIVQTPEKPRACYLLAHGAGAGMAHPFMAAVAAGLAERGVATLRYNFLYMEQKVNRPDSPAIAHSVVRAAVEQAGKSFPKLPLFAGGKSFGGRMTSQAQAIEPLDRVHGLIFLGFPLHPAGKPSDERAAHLFDVKIPMLFLQGTRDELASLALLEPLCRKLGSRAELKLFAEANHSFHVPARTGRKDPEVLAELLDISTDWMIQHV
jgi:hypothetical protein